MGKPPIWFNLPNALTLTGVAMTVGWLAGGSPWLAVAGLVIDEVDGRLARATGQETEIGSQLDWASDIALNAAISVRLGGAALYTLPIVLASQVVLRNKDWRPSIGSARAVTTAWALYREGFFRSLAR